MSGDMGYGTRSGGYGTPFGPGMKASAVDRDRAVEVLKAAFGDGRLTKDEFDARCERVMEAKTYGELNPILEDLPGGRLFRPPAPYAPYAASPFPPVAAPAVPQTSGLATGALVCGILEIFTAGMTSIPAVILGHMARSEIRRTGKRGDGLAIAALVLGYLAIAGWVIAIVAAASLAGSGSG